jgi:type IV secretory pathway protease TraF
MSHLSPLSYLTSPRRARSAAAVIVAALSLAAAGAASAKPIPPSPTNNSCSLTSGAGNTWTFPEGTVVTVTYPDGSKHQRKCELGTWQDVPSLVITSGPVSVIGLPGQAVAVASRQAIAP